MAGIDWIIVGIYLAGIILLGFFVGRKQEDSSHYFTGGRNIPSWMVGISMAANQVSAISLIGAPAFIALKSNGGLKWLQYEIAVPLAMIIIIIFIIKPFRATGSFTIYSFLEEAYGPLVRRGVSLVFLASRSLATGVSLLAAAYVTSVTSGISLSFSLLIIGGISLTYTMVGGITADIISDIIQMILLWISAIIIIVLAVKQLPGIDVASVPASRLQVFSFSDFGLSGASAYGFLPMVLGGFFLYISYYGCDQSQAQRILTTRTDAGAASSLMVNAMVRFPLVLTYSIMGVILLLFIHSHDSFRAVLHGKPADHLVPLFIARYVPPGLSGIIVSGIFAASMSSIDSAINSLSAATMDDLLIPLSRTVASLSEKRKLHVARFVTFLWGVLSVAAAFLFSWSSDTIIELVNKIGSAFYGPVAALFMGGLVFAKQGERRALTALAAGVAVNLFLWIMVPEISWLWWNVTGFTMTIGIITANKKRKLSMGEIFARAASLPVLLLVLIFGVIIVVLGLLTAVWG